MPSKVYSYGPQGLRLRDKWRARVKEDWREHYLGVYDTREEAKRVEEEFKRGR